MAYKPKYTIPNFAGKKPVPKQEKPKGELVETDNFLRSCFILEPTILHSQKKGNGK